MNYYVKRIIIYFLTLYIAVSINFIIPRLVPGNPFQILMMRMQETLVGVGIQDPEIIRVWTERFGLNDDLFTQYIRYMERLVLHGDLGPSYIQFPGDAMSIIMGRAPYTIGLMFTCVVISWLIGTALGTIVAWKEGKVSATIIGLGMVTRRIPFYMMGLGLVYLFAYILHILPARGAPRLFTLNYPSLSINFIFDLVKHSLLPGLSIVIASIFGWMITMRAFIVNILEEDFLTLAKAKGLYNKYIRDNYVKKNAMIPQLTGLALSMGGIAGGSLVMENIFSYPGLGLLLSEALNSLDYNVLQAIFIFIVFGVLTANLIVDFIYPLLDPRVSR